MTIKKRSKLCIIDLYSNAAHFKHGEPRHTEESTVLFKLALEVSSVVCDIT